MKVLKKALLALVVLIALLAAVGFLLPSHYRVERSVMIDAQPEAIYPHLATLKSWPEWTAWNTQRYPDMKNTFSGPESGAGATYAWDGKEVGLGKIALTAADPNRGVEYDLDFQNGQYLSKGKVTMEPTGNAVKVTWVNEGDLGANPVSRYFGLMMDRMMGPDFETGLNNLKQRAEGK
jgi:hypothetical protein